MGLFYALYRNSVPKSLIHEEAVDEAVDSSPLHSIPPIVLVFLALTCLVMCACVAGLTLGLMSLDSTSLGIVMRSDDPLQAAAARAIKPVRDQGNLLLVTLLFTNTLSTELLPLLLEALVPGGTFALIVSVVSIMLFGEIIPQSICSRHPLLIGYYMIGFVKFLRTILYPIAAPIAFLLDYFLGEELATIYNREELKGLIDVHRSNAVLTQDETTILKGALEFSQKSVDQIMTPAENVFKLDIDSVLDRDTLVQILRSGHSRVPLYADYPQNIVCLLLVKQLILVNPEDNIPIRSLISKKKRNHKIRVAPALECSRSVLIADLLNEFQIGRSHMAVVYDDVSLPAQEREFIGIVSIEDIIEEILQEEIIDETDNFTDNTNTTKVLVRNSAGHLVRTTAQNTHAVVVPGTSAAVLVKEIDGSCSRSLLGDKEDKYRTDWKRQKSKRKLSSPTTTDGAREPLLNNQAGNDLETGTICPDRNAHNATPPRSTEIPSTSPPNLQRSARLIAMSPMGTQTQNEPYTEIQYARMPGMSSLSLLNEDDLILPEDLASSSDLDRRHVLARRLESRVTNGEEVDESPRTSMRKLKLRPLPKDASDERVIKIPPRNRSGQRNSHHREPRTYSNYGAVHVPFDNVNSGDETAILAENLREVQEISVDVIEPLNTTG